MNRLGIRQSCRGHQYIQYAITLVQEDASLLLSMTGTIYPAISAHYDVSPASVEHAIRYTLERSWKTGNRMLFDEIAGFQLQYRPYSKEFIAMLLEYLRHE